METFVDHVSTKHTEGSSSGSAEQCVDDQTPVNYYDAVHTVKVEIEEYDAPVKGTHNICSSEASNAIRSYQKLFNVTVKIEEGEELFEDVRGDRISDSWNSLQADPHGQSSTLTGAPPVKKTKTEQIFSKQNEENDVAKERVEPALKARTLLTEDVIKNVESDTQLETQSQSKKKKSSQTSKHNKSKDKTVVCKVCEINCKNKSALKTEDKTHAVLEPPSSNIQNIHSGKKPFGCSRCDYKSVSKSKLMRHIRTHTGEKPFACNICDFKCIDRSSLIRHIKTHTGEKPFACNMCDYKCVTKSNLKIHTKRHSGEKLFACSKCDYKCVSKTNLKQHIIIHTGNKPFACRECDYKSNYKCHLKRHLQTHTV